MGSEAELDYVYMRTTNLSYRPDGNVALVGMFHTDEEFRIPSYYISYVDDKDKYFENLKNAFFREFSIRWGFDYADEFDYYMDGDTLIVERYYKTINPGTSDEDHVLTEDIEEADEIDRFSVCFYSVVSSDLLKEYS